MVKIDTKIMTPGERARARLARVATVKRPLVRVVPCDGKGFTADDMRRLLKHPQAGGFRSEGSIEWPLDTFTIRRLKEGSVKVVTDEKSQLHRPSHHSDPAA
jgi:hypothetical protein